MNEDLLSLLVALVLSGFIAAITYPLAERFLFSPVSARETDAPATPEPEVAGNIEALLLELVLEKLADEHEALTLRRRPRTTANPHRSALVERFYIHNVSGARQLGTIAGSAENKGDFVRLMSDSQTWATNPESSEPTELLLLPS